MAQIRPQVPGIERDAGWVPTHDPIRNPALDPGSLFNAGRHWTPFGLLTLGHTLSVNVATGGLVVSVADLSIPYQTTPLQLTRTLDVQEQHAQELYLNSHPNTDPRPHFFGNWQLDREVQVSSTWNHAYPEVLVDDGQGNGSLYYRAEGGFAADTLDGGRVEELLRSYGVPGRTLNELGWRYAAHDLILRSRRGSFGILTGRFQPETMIDPADVHLWRFDPVTGMGWEYTSQYSYQQFVDTDGLREVNVATLLSLTVDGLGHTLSFQPAEPGPPHRSYLLTDGTGRSLRLELEDFITYLDGNHPGGLAKSYTVSRATDETRPNHNVVEYDYEGRRLDRVRYPGQAGGVTREFSYDYDDRGHLVRITDPLGSTVRVDYLEDLLDADDRLLPRLKVARITDAEGNSASYAYNHPAGRVSVTFRSPDGQERTVMYRYELDIGDTQERYVTSETIDVVSGPSGAQTVRTRWIYSQDGHFTLRAAVDPLGNAVRLEYNDFNQPTALTDQVGHRREFAYDVQGTPTPTQPNRYDLLRVSERNTDLDGNTFPVERHFEFQPYGAATSGDLADGTQSTHRIRTRTNELGRVWTHDYDDAASHRPLRPTSVTDPLGKVTHRTYDAAGALLEEIDAEGNTWARVYNLQGQLTRVRDPNSSEWHWLYDLGTGWVEDATDALGVAPGDPAHSVHYEWNDAGQRIRETDAVGDITEYTYFANQRLRSVTRFDPTPRRVEFSYDMTGRLTGLTDPRGHTTVFRYDEAGRLYETYRDAPANPSIQFVMDAAGRVVSATDRNGQTTHYGYNALGRVISINEPHWPSVAPVNAGKSITAQYDDLGHRLRVTDSQLPDSYRYRYDAAGNLCSRTGPFGSTLTYTYDERNDLVRLTDEAGVIDLRFGRDDAGRLSSVTDSDHLDPARTFHYIRTDGPRVDNLYRIVGDSSGLETHFEYDPNRQLTSILHDHSGTRIADYGYTYRPDGLIEQATGDHKGAYDYDGLKQLVLETDAGVQDAYDAAGNRLWRAAAPVPPAQQNIYDPDNHLLQTPSDGTAFTYDNNGNMLTRQRQGGGQVRHTYDGANRLMRVEDGAKTIAYLYDPDGRMLQRMATDASGIQTRRFRYANRSILATLNEQDHVLVIYTRDDEGRLLRRRGATLNPAPSTDTHSLFYLHDGLRSVGRLVDWDGTERLHASYDAWGKATATGVTTNDPFRYRGAFEDPDTGLLQFGARWYDSTLGRWLTQDPLLAGLAMGNADLLPSFAELGNLYAYVRNSPLNLQDPEGLGAVLPKGWPVPPDWKGGYKWKNQGRDKLVDPDGDTWHWHPEDEGHNEHWDLEDNRGKRRVDKDGRDLGDDAFKDKEKNQGQEEEGKEVETAKRVLTWAAIGVGAWEIGKWGVAAILAIPSEGLSLAGAAALP